MAHGCFTRVFHGVLGVELFYSESSCFRRISGAVYLALAMASEKVTFGRELSRTAHCLNDNESARLYIRAGIRKRGRDRENKADGAI